MATVTTTEEQLTDAVPGILPAATWKVWAAIAGVSVAWGTTFLAIRVMVRTIPPLIGGGVRYLLACSMMFGIVLARRRFAGARPMITGHSRRVHASLFVLGAGLAGSFSGIGIAERHLDSSLAALIYASVPLWVVLMRVVFGRERLRFVTLAGTAIGFLGVALVLVATGSRHANVSSLVICVVASTGWSAAVYAGTRLTVPGDTLVTAGYEVLWGGVLSIAVGFAIGEGSQLHLGSISLASLCSVLYLTLVASGVGFTSFAWLLKHAPVSRTATSSYLVPLVAVFSGWLILDERIGPATALGAALIVASILVTVKTDHGHVVLEEPPAP